MCIRNNRQSRKAADAFRNRFAERDALSADRYSVTGIFNVAAGVDSPVMALYESANFETGVRSIGEFARLQGEGDELLSTSRFQFLFAFAGRASV
jgi:hypothetical protein